MAAASSSPFTLTFLCLYCSLVVCVHFPSASSLNFSLDFSKTGDPCGRELVCKGDASFRSTMIELTRNDGVNPSSWSRGMVWYATPVPLWNAVTAEVASFTSTFSFNITRVEGSTEWADGMAFFLSSYARDGSVLDNTYSAGLLGLFKQYYYQDVTGDSRVLAVEFDTIRNLEYWDSSSQHVGIDVNSIKSVSYTNTTSPDKNLTSGFTMTATVRYNNGSKLLAVDLRIDDTLYHVNATVDLNKELPEEVAIGFSATTGLFYELHGVLSWSFNSSLEAGQVPPPVKPGPSEKLLLKVLIPVASVSVFAIVCLLLWLWRKPRRKFKPIEDGNNSESDEQQGEADFERGVAGPRRYSYRELAAATGGFAEDNMLGRGGFGSVYKGCLPNDIEDGQLVAIKKFSSESSQSRKEFEAEVKIIGRLRHRNLVQLLGWCDSRKGLLLVYELVPEGSLDKHIYDSQRVLTWAERYNIIVGLGSALCYLHRDWEQCVVHGDIKPSNIMLDSAYNGKLGDFGLARLGDHGSGPKTTIVKGTMGYIDPEFVNTSRRSTQSDVYSFGIVLLEIVSGRPPVNRFDPSFMLMKWVWNHYSQGKILDAADERLRTNDKATERQMERALVVGLWCTLRDPEQRPWVGDALHILQSEDRLPDLPLQMYKMAAAPLSFGAGESGASGSSFSSGVRSLDITGTTRSSESSINRSDL